MNIENNDDEIPLFYSCLNEYINFCNIIYNI